MRKTLMKAIRICAALLLLAMGFCGCNVTGEPTATVALTETPTNKTTYPVYTRKPTEAPATTERETADPTAPKKRVALTFDDGPDDVNTKLLVDSLESYGFNATFFVVGTKLDGTKMDGSEILKYVLDKGNEVGIHAYTNSTPYGDTCSDETYEAEISKTREAINNIVPDYEVRLMRPVQGIITDARVAACPYPVVLWSIDTYDWKYTERGTEKIKNDNISTIVETVLTRIKEGDIVLMHEVHDNSYEAALIILEELYYSGYEVVTVSELLGDKAEPGKKVKRVD